jgi:hypothetical protein
MSTTASPTSPSTSTQIDEYEVMYSTGKFAPRIWLKNQGKYIGQIIFNPDSSTLPPDALVNSQVNLYYHLSDFQNVLSLLREDKNRFLLYVSPTSENGIKTTPK